MIRRKIDFANIIRELGDAGVPQVELSRETGYTQAAFAQIVAGRVKEPGWSIGDYLIRKHREAIDAPSPK